MWMISPINSKLRDLTNTEQPEFKIKFTFSVISSFKKPSKIISTVKLTRNTLV